MSHEKLGLTDEWYTPKYIFDALECEFDLDVASPVQETFVPAINKITENSLDLEWNGFVWCNAPFGGRNGLIPWNKKFISHNNGIELTPDRTSAEWWQHLSEQTDAVLILKHKVKFIKPNGATGNNPSNGTTLFASGYKAIEAFKNAERNKLGKLYYNHKKIQ